MTMTFFFETYGCQMNQAESASVERLLVELGWEPAPEAERADLVILNTCSVRITAETRVAGRIAHFAALKRQRSFTLLVMGCMAERLHEEFRAKFPAVDYVVGMFERNRFSDIFRSVAAGGEYEAVDETPVNSYWFAPSSYEAGAFQSFVPIMNGCNNFCTYCIVPYVRGREVSRGLPEILSEFDDLADRGVREVTLLGQNVNSYRWTDPESGTIVDFPGLLERIARRVEQKGKIRWIRFMSSHPKDFSDALIDTIARERVLCRFIHLPVQHGSNRILSDMNRKYAREDYLALVDRIRSRIPDATLSTDILVGFPGETEADLQDTLDLIETVAFDAAYMYHYNPREGTTAFSMPNRVPDAVKKERLDRVIKLQHKISAERMRSRVGSRLIVLVESFSRNDPDELFGHTEMGEMVVFAGKQDSALFGHFVLAELTGLRGRTFRAKIIKTELEANDALETDTLSGDSARDDLLHRV